MEREYMFPYMCIDVIIISKVLEGMIDEWISSRTQFRQWATERLNEYLVKGFTMSIRLKILWVL